MAALKRRRRTLPHTRRANSPAPNRGELLLIGTFATMQGDGSLVIFTTRDGGGLSGARRAARPVRATARAATAAGQASRNTRQRLPLRTGEGVIPWLLGDCANQPRRSRQRGAEPIPAARTRRDHCSRSVRPLRPNRGTTANWRRRVEWGLAHAGPRVSRRRDRPPVRDTGRRASRAATWPPARTPGWLSSTQPGRPGCRGERSD